MKYSVKILYLVFFFTFVVYLSTLHFRPYPLSYIVKIAPLISLAVIVFLNVKGVNRITILAALVFSAIGDVILAIDGRQFFIYGLSSFALTHLIYTWLFLKESVILRKHTFLVIPFILFGIIMLSVLVPVLNRMLLPVIIYLTIIVSMGISAVISKRSNNELVLGAFLFMISDSVIAINMFIAKVPSSSYWIMLTYFPAQFLIVYGIIKGLVLERKEIT